jgi:uncharacterized coiled-coil protein SlyX
MVGESSESAVVLDNVRRLRDAPSPLIEDAERVLTDGYAWVLRAEGERLRMRASLEHRATSLERAGTDEVVELAALAQAIARVGGEIEQLRAALGELAARLSRLRMA